ncbi:hypothetical protein MNBD_PLANCTO03-92 [hydrothermal vent metagenome]|uniref:Peptidase S8/S53 domain-containing protein n=1 Tax=hydrothermal vent metagenome TaxID=652676 RepID=A0A3B1E8S6_9ZZZZ
MLNLLALACVSLSLHFSGGPGLEGVRDAGGVGDGADLVPVTIVLRDRAEPFDLGVLRGMSSDARRAHVITALQASSGAAQRGVLAQLSEAERAGGAASIEPLWIANVVTARVTEQLAQELRSRADVERVTISTEDDTPVLAAVPVSQDQSPGQRGIVCGVEAINAPDAWASGFVGEGVVIGVIDTGLCLTHPDIADRLWTNSGEIEGNGIDDDSNGFIDDIHGWNFENNSNNLADTNGHGSHVTGTIAGDGTQGTQCGVAPGAQIMTLKFRNHVSDEASVWFSMQYGLENGADVLNGSLGWLHLWNPLRPVWRQVCENTFAAGVSVVFSGGSEGSNFGIDSITTPGDVPDMITVGTTTCDMDIASFSSRGPVTWQDVQGYNDWPYPPGKRKPTIAAPGISTTSHALCGGYVIFSGAAMATAHASGAAALVLQANPDLDHYQVKQILKDTAIDRGDPGPDNTYGHGFIDAWAAVQAALDAACIADFNDDGEVNTLDVLSFLNAWTAGDPSADVNGDGEVNSLDVLEFLNRWNAGC